jgi:hypothetical protein
MSVTAPTRPPDNAGTAYNGYGRTWRGDDGISSSLAVASSYAKANLSRRTGGGDCGESSRQVLDYTRAIEV